MFKNIIFFAILICIQHNLFAANSSEELYNICEKTYDYEEAVTKNLSREEFQDQTTHAVKRLLASRANPNWSGKKNNGFTALLWACRNGHTEAAKELLAHGANIEAIITSEGWSPLHLACCHKKRDIIKLLLENNADTNKRDKKQKLPIEVLCDGNFNAEIHGDIVQLLQNE
jgi:ankyrin repeat protein